MPLILVLGASCRRKKKVWVVESDLCSHVALEGLFEQRYHAQFEALGVVEAHSRVGVVILKQAAHRYVNPAKDLDGEMQ